MSRRSFEPFFPIELLYLRHFLRASGVNGCLHVIPQHSYRVKVWALTGLLLKVDFVSCYSVGQQVLGHCLQHSVLFELQHVDSHPDIILLNILINMGTNFLLHNGKLSTVCTKKAKQPVTLSSYMQIKRS